MTKSGYPISFSNADNVSAWGGLALWAQFLKGLRFRDQLNRWSLPRPQSNRGYDPCITAYCAVSLEFFQVAEVCEVKSFDVQKIGCLD